MGKSTIIIFVSLLYSLFALGQEAEHQPAASTETIHSQNTTHEAAAHHFRPFRVAVLIGHTFIPARHSSERLIIPSWGLDLEYWFNPKWGLGLHNDVELQSFIIEKGADEIVEREYPLVITLDALYKPWKGLVLQLGPGYELERTENYFLVRFGLEYEFDLPGHWDIAPTFFYDTREKVYDTWSIALGVGKRF